MLVATLEVVGSNTIVTDIFENWIQWNLFGENSIEIILPHCIFVQVFAVIAVHKGFQILESVCLTPLKFKSAFENVSLDQ